MDRPFRRFCLANGGAFQTDRTWRLAALQLIQVPTITSEGLQTELSIQTLQPMPTDPGLCEHRVLTCSIGHDLTQEVPSQCSMALICVPACNARQVAAVVALLASTCAGEILVEHLWPPTAQRAASELRYCALDNAIALRQRRGIEHGVVNVRRRAPAARAVGNGRRDQPKCKADTGDGGDTTGGLGCHGQRPRIRLTRPATAARPCCSSALNSPATRNMALPPTARILPTQPLVRSSGVKVKS